MTNTLSSKFRTAGGLLAGVTIGLAVTALSVAPASAASADDVDSSDFLVWHRSVTVLTGDWDGDSDVDGRDFLAWQRAGSPDTTVDADAADYVVWRKHDSTVEVGDTLTFTYVVTNTSFTPDGRQLVVTIKDGPPA